MLLALLLSASVVTATPEETSPPFAVNLWIESTTPIRDVVVRFPTRQAVPESVSGASNSTELWTSAHNELARQIEWRDEKSECHVADLVLPSCAVCARTWHMGHVVIVSGASVAYRCECWQPWEAFEMNDSDSPVPDPRPINPP